MFISPFASISASLTYLTYTFLPAMSLAFFLPFTPPKIDISPLMECIVPTAPIPIFPFMKISLVALTENKSSTTPWIVTYPSKSMLPVE